MLEVKPLKFQGVFGDKVTIHDPSVCDFSGAFYNVPDATPLAHFMDRHANYAAIGKHRVFHRDGFEVW